MQFNLADLFEAVVDTVPDRIALVAGDERVSFADLDARANRAAKLLRARGVQAGQHVGLHLFNGAPFVELMIACFKLRAVPINLNYRYVPAELRYLVDNADLVAVATQQELSPVLFEALEGNEAVHTAVVVMDDSGVDLSGFDAVDYAAGTADYGTERDFEPRSGDDLYIVYTGGTTGMPRGVMWRHEDVFFAALQGGNPGDDPIERPEDIGPNVLDRDPMVIHPAAPLIHGAAQFSFWIASMTGGKVVFVPGRSFDAAESWRLMVREEVGVVNVVGDAMARPLAECPGDFDISNLYCVASAGAILSKSVKAALEARLPDCMVINSFGASEVGHQGTAMYDDDDEGARPRFFMKPGTAIVGPDHRPVPIGTRGYIARTGRIPLGYYNDPEKTARTFKMVDGQRWVVPGDMGIADEDGFVDLLGRGAVCINTGGEKVFPEEVEEALKGHEAVMDALVVGIPDPKWQERVGAVVQLRPGMTASRESIDAFCRTRVAGYKAPRAYQFVELIARHPSGKPDYRWAREVAIAGESEGA